MQKTSTHNETTEVDPDVPWSCGYCTLDVIWFFRVHATVATPERLKYTLI